LMQLVCIVTPGVVMMILRTSIDVMLLLNTLGCGVWNMI
jgi:hypothetical protein